MKLKRRFTKVGQDVFAQVEWEQRTSRITNADGSRSSELLLSSHDVITSIETTGGLRYFSRHAEASDPIAELNRSVIGVANFSDGWVCETN